MLLQNYFSHYYAPTSTQRHNLPSHHKTMLIGVQPGQRHYTRASQQSRFSSRRKQCNTQHDYRNERTEREERSPEGSLQPTSRHKASRGSHVASAVRAEHLDEN